MSPLPYFGGDVTEKELQHVQNIILPKIKLVLRLVEAKDVVDLKPWLVTLKEAAYEAEYVLDKYDEYQQRRLKAAQVSSAAAVPTIIGVLKKKILGVLKKKKEARDVAAPPFSIKKSMEKLKKVAAEINQLTPLLAILPNQQRRQRASVFSPSSSLSLVIGRGCHSDHSVFSASVSSSLAIGRDCQSASVSSSLAIGRDCQSADSVINMLISAAAANVPPSTSAVRRIPILAICGEAGAGKTTLAQSIYKDPRVVNHFETRMWVHVSRNFDGHTVTEKIIESIKQGECPRILNFDVLQSILKDMLRSKRFFLVLDDVWCLDVLSWDQILIPLNEVGDLGSRILITCRSEEVAEVARFAVP